MTTGRDPEPLTVDRDGVILHWPAEWEEAIGYTAAETVGHKVDLVVPHALRSRHWDGFNKAMAAGRTKRDKPFTTVALHRTGRFVPLRAKLDLTYDADGGASGAEARVLGPGPAWMGPVTRVLLAPMSARARRRER